MRRIRGVPPGRAGRLWLQHRLETAERGAGLLDQKYRILRIEQQRLELREARTAAAWEEAAREAETWTLRAGLLGGRRGFRLAAAARPLDITVGWSYLMGVRYPSGATSVEPEQEATAALGMAALPGTAAVVVAADRHRRALDAAVQHAVAVAAVRTMRAELLATRRRRRAIEDRWIPRLRQALAELTLGLDELEHTDGVRLRWSAGRTPPAARTTPGQEHP